MQVVYSGGSTTPTPSPRLQRKTGYGRPVMPGYMTHVHPQILVQRSRDKFTEGDTTLRDSIPAMSRGVAIFCLVLNIIVPGSGTLVSGLSVLCCSQVRPKEDSRRHCIWVNSGVALLQFLLTFLFLLGWIWSITWGLAFLAISKQFYNHRLDEAKDSEKGRQSKPHGEGHGGKMQAVSRCEHSPCPSHRTNSNNSINKITATANNTRGGHSSTSHHHHHQQHHPHHHHPHHDQKSHPNHHNHHEQNKQPHHSSSSSKQYHQQQQQQQNHHHHNQHHHHHHSKPHQKQQQHNYNNHHHHGHERSRLHQDDSDEVAVMPTAESTSDSSNLNPLEGIEIAKISNDSSSSGRNPRSAPLAQLESMSVNSTPVVTMKITAASNENIAQPVTVPAALDSASLPQSMIPDSFNSLTAMPITTIPVAPYSGGHDDPSKRHNVSDDMPLQPIIALQRAPGEAEETRAVPAPSQSILPPPEEKVMRARTRHEKMLQRKMSDNDLSPFELTNQQLAAIIIHDLPVTSTPQLPSVQEQLLMEGLPKC